MIRTVYTGAMLVVTLQFENAYFAKCWAEKNGYPGQIRDGTQTTVIRVEEKQA